MIDAILFLFNFVDILKGDVNFFLTFSFIWLNDNSDRHRTPQRSTSAGGRGRKSSEGISRQQQQPQQERRRSVSCSRSLNLSGSSSHTGVGGNSGAVNFGDFFEIFCNILPRMIKNNYKLCNEVLMNELTNN